MEVMEYSRFFFALGLVIGLIYLFGWVAKRAGLDKKLAGITKQGGRMAVVDVLYLDRARKLTIVKADEKEYLLLLAGESAQLIATMDAKKNNEHHA